MKNNILKRFIGVIAIILPVLFTSCEEDSVTPEVIGSEIKIVSNNLLFGPQGGTGTVEFEALSAVTAYSEQPWCSVSVQGNTATVTVAEYDELENRYSSVILETENSSVRVVAQQNGVILTADVEDEYYFTDESATIEFSVVANGDVQIASSASWITYAKENDKITINLTENTSGHIRIGSFTYSCGKASRTVSVAQASAKDLYGTYNLYGYYSDRLVYLPAKISAGEGENDIIITCENNTFSWSFDAQFDPLTHTLSIPNGQYVGGLKISNIDFYIYLCIMSKTSGMFSWDTKYTSQASVSYDNEKECTIIDLQSLVEEAASGTTSYDSWVFAGFMGQDAETKRPSGNPSTYPAILYTPYLQSN